MLRVLSFIGQLDSDIVPAFLKYYRYMGVSEFYLFLQGAWSGEELAFTRDADVTIAGTVNEPFSESLRIRTLEDYALRFIGEWIIIADADELLEAPYASLCRTVASLSCLGLEELPAVLLQRVSSDGELSALQADDDLNLLFPCFDFRLSERMGVSSPIWKEKYPLVRVTHRFRLLRGNHVPHTGRASAHAPIRGVVHHFKWRDRLSSALRKSRGLGSNQHEMDAYRHWLEQHESRLPTTGLRVYSRARLFKDGYLLRPNRNRLMRASALRKARANRHCNTPNLWLERVQAIPRAIPQPPSSAVRYLDRKSLLEPPGRIAIVTSHIYGPTRTSGIGTAMSALAEQLAVDGHHVHILFCPHVGEPRIPDTWMEYWAARGISLSYYPRRVGAVPRPPQDEFIVALAAVLDREDWDVIHFHEAGGYAAAPLLLRAAGLRFQQSKIVVTVHGPTQWHRVGNYLPWNADEAMQSRFESISLELADLVVYPSEYIKNWCKEYYPSRSPFVLVPNAMMGDTRRFNSTDFANKPINTVVFFGRMEPRKGLDIFIEAIDSVLKAGRTDLKVVFLGIFGETLTSTELEARISSWPCSTEIISNYSGVDAIHLLRNENCLAVIPSRMDNVPYTVYESLENGIPLLTSGVGGIGEMIDSREHDRIIVGSQVSEYATRILAALEAGAPPGRLSFDPDLVDFDLLSLHSQLMVEARRPSESPPKDPSKITVILYGGDGVRPASPLGRVLKTWREAGIELLSHEAELTDVFGAETFTEPSHTRLGESAARACNRLGEIAAGQYLLFCRSTVVPFPECLTAMAAVLESAQSDAVVCGYRTVGAHGIPTDVVVFGPPAELATTGNLYGPGIFMVRKSCFLELGGFDEAQELASVMDWDILNRLQASQRRIMAVPIAMALVPKAAVRQAVDGQVSGKLLTPWVDGVPAQLQGFIRMALHSTRPRTVSPPTAPVMQPNVRNAAELLPDVQTGRTSSGTIYRIARKGLGAALRHLFSGFERDAVEQPADGDRSSVPTVTKSESSSGPAILSRPPKRTGELGAEHGPQRGQSLAGAAGTVGTAGSSHDLPLLEDFWSADSPLQDILTGRAIGPTLGGSNVGADGRLLDARTTYWVHSAFDALGCDFLVLDQAFDAAKGERLCAALYPLWEHPSLDPDSDPTIRKLSLAEVSRDRPKAGRIVEEALRSALLRTANFYRLKKQLRPESVSIVRREAGSFEVHDESVFTQLSPPGLRFRGILYLNQDYIGGEQYFPGTNMIVRPSKGMFVAATFSPYHNTARLRLESGSQIALELTMVAVL